MTTITDPQSWLTALPGPRGPTRGEWCPEGPLQRGDVTDAGEIVLYDGCSIVTGSPLVEVHQAYEATYYGWKDSGMRVWREGRMLAQIFRYA